MSSVDFESVNLNVPSKREEVVRFLNKFELVFEENIDYTIVYRVNEEIVATASIAGNILKCFAISEEYRAKGILEALNKTLIDKLFSNGVYHYFVFTKPHKMATFNSLGYKLVYKTEKVVLFEHGIYNIEEKLLAIAESYNIDSNPNKIAVVIYPNSLENHIIDFIENIEKRYSKVLVFIGEKLFERISGWVSKNNSEITFIKDMEYMFSYELFPKYFIKEEEERKKAYRQLSTGIIEKYFYKTFNIKMIYFCEEINK